MPFRTSRATGVALALVSAIVSACSNNDSPTSGGSTQITGPCSASAAAALAVGQATTPSSATICVAGGTTGAEFALVAFNGATDATTTTSLSFTPTNTTAPTASLTNDASIASASTMAPSFDVSAGAPLRRLREWRPRAAERRALRPRMSAARSWYSTHGRSSGARLSVVGGALSVGQTVSLNANADDACDNPTPHGGRVEAISNKAVVVADTLNPPNGYTSADYASVAATFDTLVDPVDTKNFGEPTDIDGNGHVVLFFTRAVNALTPKNADYYIAGFFFARDLFPTTATTTLDACAGSNLGEMFYLMVPDPTGVVNGNTFTKTFVTNAVIATVAHEYEHLINASRRLYVNSAASDFEEGWLDEGLAHSAEELVFYARSHLTPRANISATTLRSSSAYVDAFNEHAISNFGRLESFLEKPSTNSPWADPDTLATRGAIWSFLRYAVDQSSASDQSTVFFSLVNSPSTGFGNLAGVFGADLSGLFRDWSLSLLMDDRTGADARLQEASWNLRSIDSAISDTKTYSLASLPLQSGVAKTVTVNGGGSAYLQFAVAANTTASVLTTLPPSTVALSLVRLR